ncbi:hypothetical protein B566_EDAN008754 [Ephemera danica]|nr:hypothetical protein B566_EDAN008754 [Ephemera danica]
MYEFTRDMIVLQLLQDTQLISLICALLLIDCLIVTLWVSVDPMQRHLRNLSLEISTSDRSVVYQPQVEVCRSQNTHGWLGALYVYKGLLLIVGVYMAWETSVCSSFADEFTRVKIPALNDSQYIGMSVYSVVITSGIVVVLANLISERATLAFVTITTLIFISTTTTLCLLFVPKIHTIWIHPDGDPIVESMGLKIECNTRRFVIDERRERYYRVEVQNRVYRRELAALDAEVGRLERMLLESPTLAVAHSPRGSASASPSRSSMSLPGDHGFSGHDDLSYDEEYEELPQPLPLHDPRTGAAALLLSVIPSVVPRASWPCAAPVAARPQVTFCSEPKLEQVGDSSEAGDDSEEGCEPSAASALLRRLLHLNRFWRPGRNKAAANHRSAVAAALRMHVSYVTGLVPDPQPERKFSLTACLATETTAPVAPAFRERARGSPRFPHRIVPANSGLLPPSALRQGSKCRSLDASINLAPCSRCGDRASAMGACANCGGRRDKPRAASLSPNCDVWCVDQAVAATSLQGDCPGELTITIHRTDSSQCT